MRIVIPLCTVPKKNSQQIFINSKTHKPFIRQSERYLTFEKQCGYFLNGYKLNIDYAVNLKCIFIAPDRRKRDLCNLLESIQDILVKYNVIADDNYNIIASVDGSRIKYIKGKQETIIDIERGTDEK